MTYANELLILHPPRYTMNMNIFETADGERVITQKPNLSISIAFTFLIVGYLTNGDVSDALNLASSAAFVIWAWSEIIWGVNTYRRLLGAGVLLVIMF